MTGRRSVETAIDDTFTKYLTDKGKGDAGDQGAYRADAERELHRFRRWCLGETADSANASPPESWAGVVDGDTVRFADLDTTVFSDYARYLSTAGYAAGTVLTYYAHVASWCGWAHAQGYLPRHYARESDAEDPLPENDGRRPGDQQAWGPIHRDLITQFVDRRVSEAFDGDGDDITAFVGDRLAVGAVKPKSGALPSFLDVFVCDVGARHLQPVFPLGAAFGTGVVVDDRRAVGRCVPRPRFVLEPALLTDEFVVVVVLPEPLER